MKLHLIDGTYELFRNHFGAPERRSPTGMPVGATCGLLRTLLAMARHEEITHAACAFDHVIESFRNDLFAGYKSSAGVDPDLLAQFTLAERAARALGYVVWPMVEHEADDAIATAAARWSEAFEQIIIVSPDKDFSQCVRGERIVCRYRHRRRKLGADMRRAERGGSGGIGGAQLAERASTARAPRVEMTTVDEAAVVARFGVGPASVPDWLALVGDSADGIPGIRGWGPGSSSVVLARYGHVENIPMDETPWDVRVQSAQELRRVLREHRREALLFRHLATLVTDVPLPEGDPEELRWRGVDADALAALAVELGDADMLEGARRWAAAPAGTSK